MTIEEAMKSRHSIRSFTGMKITGEVLDALLAEIETCNAESGLALQLLTDEPGAFTGFLAHYGRFRNVANYIALVGKESPGLGETTGYYGERLVLKAQQLGLSTCWVAGTYRRSKCAAKVAAGEKLLGVIAIGYGAEAGKPHKNKPMEMLCKTSGPAPQWFQRGMEAALLAPTAVNRQDFFFTLVAENSVEAASPKSSTLAKVDLGIAKYHFELGAGKENFTWAS